MKIHCDFGNNVTLKYLYNIVFVFRFKWIYNRSAKLFRKLALLKKKNNNKKQQEQGTDFIKFYKLYFECK
jgi:hypothetical protein